MSLWEKLFGTSDKNESVSLEVQPEDDMPGVTDKYIPNSLDLGWFYSEGKDEFQMAKIADKDRSTHMYVVGASGSGKTKFLEFLIRQDIEKGRGFGAIDAHGDLIEDIKAFLVLECLESERMARHIRERLVIVDPTDPKFTVTFNPLEILPNVNAAEQANELVAAFRKIWSDSWGVRMEDLMRNTLIVLSEAELTLAELPRFLTSRANRRSILANISHPIASEYFKRFETLTDRAQITWIEPVMNKLNAFFADERIRQMFSSSKSSFNLRDIMDKRKILLIKLDKGKLKDSADLLGSLFMAKIQMAAFSRSDIPQSKRIPFYLYIDEFQNYASDSFETILSEARKYGLSLIMAHQTLAQISTELRSLILGNTGLQVYFRVNRQDASLLAKEAFEYSGFEVKSSGMSGPRFWSLGEEWEKHTEELQKLSPRQCYVKHKIEGGLIRLYTVEIESGRELAGMNEEEFAGFAARLALGGRYLIDRQTLLALPSVKAEITEAIYEPESTEETKPKAIPKEGKKPEKPESGPQIPKPATRAAEKAGNDELEPDELVLLEFINRNPGKFVTRIYQELGLSGYKGDKLKAALIEGEYIVQKETREGKRGRLAKVLEITKKGAALCRKVSGKGGDAHQALQEQIREQAELVGWQAVVEERIGRSLESVDVGVSRGDVRVAVEICSTTKAGHEMENIRKCLDAGYDYVLSVGSDEKSLGSLKAEAKKAFSLRERERIRFYVPSEIKDFLRSLSSDSIVSEKAIVSGQLSKQKLLLNMDEAAQYLGISKNTLYEWVVQQKIPHTKVGRLTKFKREDLDRWLTKNTRQQRDRDFV